MLQLLRTRSFLPLVAAALAISILYLLYTLSGTNVVAIVQSGSWSKPGQQALPHEAYGKPSGLSISELIEDADHKFEALTAAQSQSLSEAARMYRDRRGVHPPPGFDLWYDYAVQNNAVIVEEFWDQIYHDLNPLWSLEPSSIRALARELGMTVVVKDGKVSGTASWFWHEIWGKMIGQVAHLLPDMVIALNAMDESRVLVPSEAMDNHMHEANKNRQFVDPYNALSKIQGWHEKAESNVPKPDPITWNQGNVYRFARNACANDTPARQFAGTLSAQKIMAEHQKMEPAVTVDQYFDGKFVTNYTAASDFCQDASIGGMHGALMLPLTVSVTEQLVPLFGGSKFHINNEILIPAPMYWNGEERFGGADHQEDKKAWMEKENRAIWRGTATGGQSKPFVWHLFHRHRFVAITNGTKYDLANEQNDLIFNSLFRQTAIDSLGKGTKRRLGSWLNSIHDVGFTDLMCDENEPEGACWYTNDEFKIASGVSFEDQFNYKYLPDIDGNSFSGRYRAFLRSNSVPIKATIFREWHDSRLVPWKHFVPMNNRFSDYYKIMEYFLGSDATGTTGGVHGHDEQAQKIAEDGREWANKVLRKEDMQIYTLRLLLEYARVTDDHRQNLAWVDDLTNVAHST